MPCPNCNYHYHNIFLVQYQKIKLGTLCSDQSLAEIESAYQCKDAGEGLGLKWGGAWDGPNEFPRCYYADNGINEVWFNTSPTPKRTNLPEVFAAICIIPFD